jgi:hypothetical protein
LTSDGLQFIQAWITYGASPGTIWSKLGTAISPRKLAYLHHKQGEAGQTETKELLDALRHWKGRTIVHTFADIAHMQMECCFFVHSRVADLKFASEVLVMDDTFCTNNFGLHLATIIIDDWEARNQLPAEAFLSNRTITSFKSFLIAAREKLSSDVRAVLTYHSHNHLTAISEVFPKASIVFYRAILHTISTKSLKRETP